jgi:hypothetical protein
MADDDGIGGSGYSMEQLSDYHDRGRTPPIPAIDSDPQCQAVLDSLERFGALSRDLVASEARDEVDAGWFDAVMREVVREARAGRDIPLVDEAAARLFVTEGAVRGLVREAGDAVRGALVGQTRIEGDVSDPASEVIVHVSISVAYGHRIQDVADEVRRVARDALVRHTALRVVAVDVIVDTVHGSDHGEGGR